MKFIDEAHITITAGTGGDGCMSFRREKFIPRGGPDGGNGGDGGNVYFEADSRLNTLIHFQGKKFHKAQDGTEGGKRRSHGKKGKNLLIKTPVGTLIKNADNNHVIADLVQEGQKILVARGGRGGLGNDHFKTSTNRAPRYTTKGRFGESFKLDLELKLLADISLIGMPNVGKSTLISTISKAKPKIADYEFTTLEPNLGIVSLGEDSFVVADVPGLIENASKGRGLGVKFLKHIERTKAFVHIVDISWCLDVYEAYDAYITVKIELEKYNPELLEKTEIICLAKIDTLPEEETRKFKDFFEKTLNKNILPISCTAHKNIDLLKGLMLESIKT